MRERRVTNAFEPRVDEAEKRAGASVFLFGQAMGDASSVANQPPAAGPDHADAGVGRAPEAATDARSLPQDGRLTPPGMITPTLRIGGEGETKDPAPDSLSVAAASRVGGGVIRPMSLTPDQPSKASFAPFPTHPSFSIPPSSSTAAASPGAAPSQSLPSPASGVANNAAAPGTDGNSSPSNTQSLVFAGGGGGISVAPQVLHSSKGVPLAERHGLQSAHHRGVAHPSGGLSLGDGYAATGGPIGATRINQAGGRTSHPGSAVGSAMTSREALVVQPDISGGGTSTATSPTNLTGPAATGLYSGTGTGAISGSLTGGGGSQSSAHASGGTFTFPASGGSGGSGGGGGQPIKGNIFISGGGDEIIGGKPSFNVAINGVSGATLSNITWGSSGAPVMYSGQTVPKPATQTQFTNAPYSISAQHTSSVSFSWGEKIGLETITVNADVTLNGKTVPADQAKLKVYVCSPGVDGEVKAAKSAAIVPQQSGRKLMYCEVNQQGIPTVAGIDWGALQPSKGGTYEIVQIVNGGTVSVLNGSGHGFSGPGKLDTSTNPPTFTPAPANLIDVPKVAPPATPADPFYHGTSDLPSVGLVEGFTSTKSMSVTDYVMYQAPGGSIWVPEGTFSWSYKSVATDTPNAPIPWKVTTPITPTKQQLKVKIDHTAWPSGWNGLAYQYRGSKKV